jgi:hypothetical protein
MAHFYGTVEGNRGQASRLGSKVNGLTTTAASWQGAVVVYMRHNKGTGKDTVFVTLQEWEGQGVYRILYKGTIDGIADGS